MNLWIRSQDKKRLYSAKALFLSNDGNKYSICGYIIPYSGSGASIFGYYKSKERALEVLDEIEKRILELDKRITHYELDCVYQMPEE